MFNNLVEIEKVLEEIRKEEEITYYFNQEKLEKLRTIMILEKANFDANLTYKYIDLIKEFNWDKEFSVDKQYLNSILLMFSLNKADYIATRRNDKSDLIFAASALIFILNKFLGDNFSSEMLSEYIGLISGLFTVGTLPIALSTTLNKINHEINIKPIEEKLNLNLTSVEEKQFKKYKKLFEQILDFIYLSYDNEDDINNIKTKNRVK